MSERAKMSVGQIAVGVSFCALGCYFGVSIGLHLAGQEPVVGFATQPVLELIALLGPISALLAALGVAVVGAWVFLASLPPAIGRPLAALGLGSAGFALVLGAFGYGGALGDVFPGLVAGVTGRLIGAVLGVAVAFFGATLLAPRRGGASTADVMRMGLASRGDLAAGVSSAEAALLGGEPRPAARPVPRRDEPVRGPILRPIAPEAKVRAVPAAVAAVAAPAPTRAPTELPAPSAPAWEASEPEPESVPAPQAEADLAPEDEEERELAAELAEALTEDDTADDEQPLAAVEDEEESTATPAASASAPPPAAWEQVGLFDEDAGDEEEELATVEPARPAALVTPPLAFEDAPAPRHEPERATADDPFAAEPFPAPAAVPKAVHASGQEELDEEEELADEPGTEAELEDAAAEPAVAAPRVPASEFVLQPTPAPRPEPVVERDGARERWEKLVFDSGALIVEQKRVAVSMLERRFGIGFDDACKVLDELQQAGLIGPYIGGRTREILLTREQWLAQAPQTA